MFSVVIPVTPREIPSNLRLALRSVFEQTLAPKQVVVVKDGVFSPELEEVIEEFSKAQPNEITVVILPHPHGVSEAMNKGLEVCRFSIVARMDSDDVSCPHRFEVQYKFLEEHPDVDVVGGVIEEFYDDPDIPVNIRRVPLESEEIIVGLRKRNPVNNVTTMFRKEAIERVGGNKSFKNHVDYYLWARMVEAGCKLVNLDDVLVKVRADSSQMLRRGGWNYFQTEVAFQRVLLELGLTSRYRVLANLAMRFVVRVSPLKLRKFLYRTLR